MNYGSRPPQPVLIDTIFAVGRPDAALAQELGTQAIAFLGEKNTYLLIEGGDVLMQIATEVDGERIGSYVEPRALFLKDKTVWGSMMLSHFSVKNPEEAATLTRLGFAKGPMGNFERQVLVKGRIYPPLPLSDEQGQQFKRRRSIRFYDPPDSSSLPALNPALPAAIVADVATFPFQVIGLGVIAITIQGRKP